MSTKTERTFIPEFSLLWELTCDEFPVGVSFSYSDLKSIVKTDPKLSYLSSRTIASCWQMVTHYAITTGQMRRLEPGIYEWISTTSPTNTTSQS